MIVLFVSIQEILLVDFKLTLNNPHASVSFTTSFQAAGKVSTPVLVATIKSIALLTDVFTDRLQYEWALSALVDVYKTVGTDDGMVLRHLLLAMAKTYVTVVGDHSASICC